MAKEPEHNNDVVDTEVVRIENDYDAEVPSNDAMETSTIIRIHGPYAAQPNEPLIHKTEKTQVTDTGLKETTEITLRTASCGCLMHTSKEASVCCSSCSRLGKEPLVLCCDCAKKSELLCAVCNYICCYQCRHELPFLDRPVCSSCLRTKVPLIVIKKVAIWLVILATVVYLITF